MTETPKTIHFARQDFLRRAQRKIDFSSDRLRLTLDALHRTADVLFICNHLHGTTRPTHPVYEKYISD